MNNWRVLLYHPVSHRDQVHVLWTQVFSYFHSTLQQERFGCHNNLPEKKGYKPNILIHAVFSLHSWRNNVCCQKFYINVPWDSLTAVCLCPVCVCFNSPGPSWMDLASYPSVQAEIISASLTFETTLHWDWHWRSATMWRTFHSQTCAETEAWRRC